MTTAQMKDFATTKEKGLPERVKKMSSGGAVIGSPKDHQNFRQLGIKSYG
jgi:alanine racemase